MKFNIGDIVRIKASKYDVMEGVGREDLVETNVTVTDVQESWDLEQWNQYKIDKDIIWYPESFFYLVDDDSGQYDKSDDLDEFLAGFSKEAANG